MRHSGKAAQALTLQAVDGYPLSAYLYATSAETVKGQLLIAGATGVGQQFYRRFAEYACGQGFNVLTLDYRGIAQSAPKQLKGFKMDFEDWGQLDLAAAVDFMHREDLPLFLIGHSYGGHALGLLPNHHKVSRCYTLGTGAGWHGWMPLLERLKVQFMWNVLFPVLVAWKGYLPWKMLGLGEDMPRDAYQQWKRWCGMPHYFFDDPQVCEMKKLQFAQVRTPITAAVALDDLWALPASRDAFMDYYSNASVIRRDIDPQTFSLAFGAMGHMGYFRASAQPLWDEILAWFVQPLEVT
jgi:predicted alpha/beta hydrolase